MLRHNAEEAQKYLLLRRQLSSETQLLKQHLSATGCKPHHPPAACFYTEG